MNKQDIVDAVKKAILSPEFVQAVAERIATTPLPSRMFVTGKLEDLPVRYDFGKPQPIMVNATE